MKIPQICQPVSFHITLKNDCAFKLQKEQESIIKVFQSSDTLGKNGVEMIFKEIITKKCQAMP